MIDERDIENALKAILSGASLGYPINWPNQSQSDAKPRLEVLFAGGERTGGTLKGGEVERSEGILSVAVVWDIGESTGDANDVANSVKALYVEGARTAITGGSLVITKPPTIQKGFKDGPTPGQLTEWRVPVVIEYRAETT